MTPCLMWDWILSMSFIKEPYYLFLEEQMQKNLQNRGSMHFVDFYTVEFSFWEP